MDLKYYITEFQKQKNISQQFQIKLGELIINMTNNQLIYDDDQIRTTIKLLQEFLCHRHYIEYITLNKKEKQGSQPSSNNQIEESSTTLNNDISSNNYDNCMNLLLVVLAKIAKLSNNYSVLMIDYFVEHITSHIECFNYIISFYRLYISCSQIKSASKEYELYNNLFEFYKRMYYISLKYENMENYSLRDMKKLVKGSLNSLNNDKKYFLDTFKSKNSEITSNNSNVSEKSRHIDKSPESILISQLRRDKTEEKLKNQNFSIFNPFKSSQKTQVSSKTERKINSINSNINVSGNKSTNSDNNLKSLNQKSSTEIEINIENLKKKVPNLRLPINVIDQHFSLTRSSRRADFSSSTTSKKLQEKSNLLNIKRDSNEPIILQDKEKSIISNLKDTDEKENSPIEKLKTIAFQLGESCLATDLSCLINQKRDLELEKLAREKMGKKESVINLISNNSKKPSEFDYIEKLKYSDKIESDYEIVNKENQPVQEVKSFNDKMVENKVIDNNNTNIYEITKDFKQKFIFTFESHIDINFDKNYKNYLKIREILTNFILSCIREYSIEEIHLVKINYNMIYCYVTLPSIDQMRKKIDKKKLDYFESEFEIDYKNILTEGSVNVLDRDILRAGAYLTLEKLQSEDQTKNRHNYFVSRDKTSFDSLLTINYEEEKGSLLSLKSEYESLVDLLIIHFSSIENNIKQQNFFKQLYESVENPEPEKSEFWCDGIRFSNFHIFTQDKIRKHCDGFFDKIRNRITFILKHYDFKNNGDIWKTLNLNLITLRDYISNAKSRIISTFVLFEFMEILVILKKNFILYFSNISNFEFTCDDMKYLDKSENYFQINNDILEMFSIYLDLLSKLIQNSNLIISDKLLNESFIICPSFLEIIRFVLIYLFTHDIYDKLDTSITNTNIKNNNNNVSLTVSTRKFSAKKFPKLTLINFLKDYDMMNIELKSSVFENYKFFVSTALTIVNYFNVCSLFFHKIIKQENLDKTKNEEKESSKYWICSTRDFLKFLNLFIESKNGLFYEYINEYGSYMKVKTDINANNSKTVYQTVVPMNFPLTKSILNLFHSVFDFSHNLSIIVNENTSLDLIRMHYICFIKFYNKNLDFTEKIGDLNRLIENSADKKKKIKQLIKDIYNDTNSLNLIICLCKLHLRCLFSLAKNRNSDVTNKFFQLRIVEVLVRELDLEHEANENTYKLQKYYESCKNTDKEQKDKIKIDNMIKEKNQQVFDKIINIKLENKIEKPPEEEKKQVVTEKKPAANFKGIFKHKFKPKNQENPQNISLNPNIDQPLLIEEDKKINRDNNENIPDKKDNNLEKEGDVEKVAFGNFDSITNQEININFDGTNFAQDVDIQDFNSENSINEKKNPFAINKKPALLNMSKISSNQNHEFISMIDKTKTPVFNMNLGEKFNEILHKPITEIISENKENNSFMNLSSNRENSFNEDNEDFDDIPLCDYMPKNKKYEDKIPKLDIPDTSIPMAQEPNKQEEKKEKPKVSFNNIFKKKEAPVIESKNIPSPEQTMEKKISKDSFNEDHEEFDDIPLCEFLPKNNLYGEKIPKLDLPNSSSDIVLGGSINNKYAEEKKEPSKIVKQEENKENSNNKFKFIFNKKKDADVKAQNNKPNIIVEETKLKSSNRDNSFIENDEEFDDIPLCDPLPKNKQYQDKIPKLELPNTLSEIGLGGGIVKEEEKIKISFNKPVFSLKKKEPQIHSNLTTDLQKSDLSRSVSNNDKKKSSIENSFNEDDEDFDDIPLCENLPKNNQYGKKIPKLELPNTLSEVGLGGAVDDKSKFTDTTSKHDTHLLKNKSNTEIIKINSTNPINKFSLKHKLQNKSGILSEFTLTDQDKHVQLHERKKSMPQNQLMNSLTFDKNEDDLKMRKGKKKFKGSISF